MMSDVSSLRCSTTITCVGPTHAPGWSVVPGSPKCTKRGSPTGSRSAIWRLLTPNFEPEHPLARFDILHATNQDKIHECSLLSNRPFACD